MKGGEVWVAWGGRLRGGAGDGGVMLGDGVRCLGEEAYGEDLGKGDMSGMSAWWAGEEE